MNPWTKFGFNQIKTEEVTDDPSNRVINICMHSMHSHSLRGCDKKKNENPHDNGGHEVWNRVCQYERVRRGNSTKLGTWVIYTLKILCMHL